MTCANHGCSRAYECQKVTAKSLDLFRKINFIPKIGQIGLISCATRDAMTNAWGSLHIEVVDHEIVVTLPLTSYTVTYYKPAKSPQLLAKRIRLEMIPAPP